MGLIKPVAFVPNSPTLTGNLGNDHPFPDLRLISTSFLLKLKQTYDFYEFAPELYNVRYEPSRGPEFVDQIISVRWNNRVHKECNSSIYREI